MRNIFIIIMCLISIQTVAQEKLRITLNDNTYMDFDVKAIKNMDLFSNSSIKIDNLVGEWVQYEDRILSLTCWEFMRDGTYVYKSYNYDSQLIFNNSGTFTLEDNVLTIDYSGFNIPERIISCTDSEFSSSSDTYYKVIGDYSMALDDNPITIGNDGDIIKYVDNCIIGIENNKITPLKEGSGYALVEDAVTKKMKAYRVDVLPVEPIDPDVIEWTQYFNNPYEEILAKFGSYTVRNDITNGDMDNSITYMSYNEDISYLKFFFTEDWNKVIKILANFTTAEKLQKYSDVIVENYYFNTTQNVYYDKIDENASSVKIRVISNTIVYESIKIDLEPLEVRDWIQYFGKSKEEIVSEFGEATLSYENELFYDYGEAIENIDFKMEDSSGNVCEIRITFKNLSNMQNYCNEISEKFILDNNMSTESELCYGDKGIYLLSSIQIIINKKSNRIIYKKGR